MITDKHKIYLLIVLATITGSCEKDVVLQLADQQAAYMIVEANLTNEPRRQRIRITWSSSYYDLNYGDPVTGAIVKVSDPYNNFYFTYDKDGFYTNPEIGSQLKHNYTYTLSIEHEKNTYLAESTLRHVPKLDSATYQSSFVSGLGLNQLKSYDIYAHFEKLPQSGDYYLFNLYINKQLKSFRATEKEILSDENLENYVSWPALRVSENFVSPGDSLTLEIRSISRENYEFYNTLFNQVDLSGNPFAGAPPANIPTNLSNGARGFFQVSDVNKKTTYFNPD